MNTLSVHAAARHDTLYVVATTPNGTEAALRFAVLFGRKRGARVVLAVPEVARASTDGAGGPGAGDDARRPKSWLVARFVRLARTIDSQIQIRTSAAGSETAAARQLTPRCAIAVVGGRHRWWWPHQEERLAAALRRSGRHIVFVPETADIQLLLTRFETSPPPS